MSFRRSVVWLGAALIAGTGIAHAGDASIGLELQRYPVGTIGAVVYRHPLAARADLLLGVGYNDADREDEGEFSDEQAAGAGVSIGYRRYREDRRSGWSWGGRVDLWDLDVDYIDRRGTPLETRGTTETLVLQPSVVVAHGWAPGDGNWGIELSLAGGLEINVRTDGPDVGEGAILLGGVSLRRHF